MLSLCSGIVLLQSGSELIVFQARFWILICIKAEQEWNKGRTIWNKRVIVKRIFWVYNDTVEKWVK